MTDVVVLLVLLLAGADGEPQRHVMARLPLSECIRDAIQLDHARTDLIVRNGQLLDAAGRKVLAASCEAITDGGPTS